MKRISHLLPAEGPEAARSAAMLLGRLPLLTDSAPRILGLVSGSQNSNELRQSAIRLLTASCRGLLVLWSGDQTVPPWSRNPRTREIVEVVGVGIDEIFTGFQLLESRVAEVGDLDGPRQCRRLESVIRSDAVFETIANFSHSGTKDLSNRFLGPARVIAEAGRSMELSELWLDLGRGLLAEFEQEVCVPFSRHPDLFGDLGMDIQLASSAVKRACDGPKVDADLFAKAADDLMSLLTEVRQVAGARPIGVDPIVEAQVQQDALPIRVGQPPWRVVVIDDHAREWRPVFMRLRELLHVEFDFSTDGQKVQGMFAGESRGHLAELLPDYDLVLLDIYLGNQSGLKLLEEIRARIMHLPVVLWTTSMGKELPAQAALANGFIFKKTTSVDELAGVIRGWLSSGRSQRLWSLPNPFFDYNLQDPVLRETALSFTKWTLRYMDCFHAVDHFFFRYFNDHGGRHILGVMDSLARLLRPFLLGDGVNGGLLSIDARTRARQLFALYIAVLCHEFGMFPIWSGEGGTQPDGPVPDEHSWQHLDHVRRLHAIRGLLMLQSSNDLKGAIQVGDLKAYLNLLDEVGADVRGAAALVVGYHQRCLSLAGGPPGREDDFWLLNSEAGKKLARAATFYGPGGPEWTDADVVERGWATARRALAAGSLWTWEQMRQVCALFRFADSLDVDHTRVPADFLISEQSQRRALQDVEDCKRQVAARVDIDGGSVSIRFFCSPPGDDTADVLDEFSSAWLAESRASKEQISSGDSPVGGRPPTRGDAETSKLVAYLNQSHTIEQDAARQFFRALSASGSWPRPSDRDAIENCILMRLQTYFENARQPVVPVTDAIRSSMATAAATLVILELLSEYRSIEEVGLDEKIRLHDIGWATTGESRWPSILN